MVMLVSVSKLLRKSKLPLKELFSMLNLTLSQLEEAIGAQTSVMSILFQLK